MEENIANPVDRVVGQVVVNRQGQDLARHAARYGQIAGALGVAVRRAIGEQRVEIAPGVDVVLFQALRHGVAALRRGAGDDFDRCLKPPAASPAR